ncbi:hypothetical protein FH972_019676 [Carpinus fangiana]|uniref:Protein kinase domain-containing protein n=1 Tax=Carpinus fangiana TaxID=176857 RepID=A0A5N6RR02_9ROSI|nr:hypothetical protein FH972_019676 [Carpinus fangiana]
MGLLGRLSQQQLLLGAIILAAASEPTNSSCIRTCGSLQIPYPFGASESCCLDPSFYITCNNSTPFLSPSNLTSIDGVANGSCNGIGCCQTSIPKQMTSFIVVTGNINDHNAVDNFNPCSFGFVVEEKAFNFSSLDLRNLQDRESVPVVLDFSVGNETCLDAQKNLTTYACKSKHSYCCNSTNGPGYACNCSSGCEGNPYQLDDGCQAKIFSAEELKRVTNSYNESRVLGQGGNGTVYRGVLSCNKVVAIKKSRICDHSQIKYFINEVFVLTQINHRNVVKLLGCCLQTEVPLLVYEFITNGTLFDHIHDKSRSSSLSWEMRLKIAAETAIALAYLHSETSIPIFHRDVKTTNILLDDNYTAKVADFRASRLISLDQTQVITLVQETFDKKVVFVNSTGRERKLAMYFVSAVKEDCVLQIVENHIVNECKVEELKEVANLSKRCLSVTGEDRPSTKEVAMELEALTIVEKNPMGKDNFDTEETECFLPSSIRSFSFGIDRTILGFDSFPQHVLKPLGDGR